MSEKPLCDVPGCKKKATECVEIQTGYEGTPDAGGMMTVDYGLQLCGDHAAGFMGRERVVELLAEWPVDA